MDDRSDACGEVVMSDEPARNVSMFGRSGRVRVRAVRAMPLGALCCDDIHEGQGAGCAEWHKHAVGEGAGAVYITMKRGHATRATAGGCPTRHWARGTGLGGMATFKMATGVRLEGRHPHADAVSLAPLVAPVG